MVESILHLTHQIEVGDGSQRADSRRYLGELKRCGFDTLPNGDTRPWKIISL